MRTQPSTVPGSSTQGLRVLLERYCIADNLLKFAIATSTGEFIPQVDAFSPAPAERRFLVEQACCTAVTVARSLTGDDITPIWVEFYYPRPSHADAYRHLLGNELRFGATTTWICFDAAALDRSAAQLEQTHDRDDTVAEIEHVCGKTYATPCRSHRSRTV
ncbi:AraC family transcriptional regulator ligand-binding domain-containing protein [Nocardia sp. NPDC101769]|uniref:AraC family transcriptional regulator ligand-binding domain-containing protein n=1 Tax=Nocardia sp. NPDC101769 TaxID=3364333 RepID=UPI0037FBCCC5